MDTMIDESLRNERVKRVVKRAPRRLRSLAEKCRIVEETWVPGASVAVVARRHEVNANLVFAWRKLYDQGLLKAQNSTPLLPVKMVPPATTSDAPPPRSAASSSDAQRVTGSLTIELTTGHRVIMQGDVDHDVLSRLVEVLSRR